MKAMKKAVIAALIGLSCTASPAWAEEAALTPNEASVAARNATYDFYGKSITLLDGKAEMDMVAHGVSRLLTTALEEPQPVSGDLNGDGTLDAALLLKQESSGSKAVYYYLAVTLNQADGSRSGSNALLLGEGIVPQRLAVGNGVIRVDYLAQNKSSAIGQKELPLTKEYVIKQRMLVERGAEERAQVKAMTVRHNLSRYYALLGLTREAAVVRIAETPNAADEGGFDFVKEGIRIWFSDAKVSQVFISGKEISFNGLRLGDGVESFKKVFGPAVKEKPGTVEFNYKACILQLIYDEKTGNTVCAYLLQR